MNMNTKFIKRVMIAFVMLSSCNSVFASDSSSKILKDIACQTIIDSESISKYFTNNDIKINMSTSNIIEENMNSMDNSKNTKKVEYNPDIMWFDYQALFDKTKSVVLGEEHNIPVAHTNFKTNNLAREALFNNDDYKNLLQSVIVGSISDQCQLLDNCAKYLKNYCINNINKDLIVLNYNYIICIIVSLGDYCEPIRDYYISHTNCDTIPCFINWRNIKAVNFYDIVKYMQI